MAVLAGIEMAQQAIRKHAFAVAHQAIWDEAGGALEAIGQLRGMLGDCWDESTRKARKKGKSKKARG
jgi:hypothetical protein